MFKTAAQNFTVTRGETWNPAFAFTRNGEAFDLAGWTALVEVEDAFTLTGDPGLVFDGPAGTVQPILTPEQTASCSGVVHWYMELTDPSGSVGFPVAGSLIFKEP